MKTLFTTSQNIHLHHLIHLFKDDELIFGDLYDDKFPSEHSISFAHELLSFCLDNSIEKIYASRSNELSSLSESKVLYAEFGIEIILPDLNQNFIINNFIAEPTDFLGLSSKLLSAGYPNQKLAFGKADLKGDMIVIDDEIKDFNQVFSKVKSVSFLQLGKLFNQANFEALNIYQIPNELNEVLVLHENGKTYYIGIVNQSLALVIDLMMKQNNCAGFYQVNYSDNQIIRLKNIAL